MLLRLFSILSLGLVLFSPVHAGERALAFDLAESRVEIAVKATVDSFTARLTRYDPVVMVDDSGRVTSAKFGFQFRDIVTGKERRDAQMHKWQQTDTFPTGEFVLKSLEPAAGNKLNAQGQLTLHGMTRDVRFPVSVTRDGGIYAIDGEATLDTREFGLTIIRMLGVLKVDPVVHVRFHLQGRTTS
jgi:polyisoprenoid-binding protein YceI